MRCSLLVLCLGLFPFLAACEARDKEAPAAAAGGDEVGFVAAEPLAEQGNGVKITPKKRPLKSARWEERKKQFSGLIESEGEGAKAALGIRRDGRFDVQFLDADKSPGRVIKALKLEAWILDEQGRRTKVELFAKAKPGQKEANRFISAKGAIETGKPLRVVLTTREETGQQKYRFDVPADYHAF